MENGFSSIKYLQELIQNEGIQPLYKGLGTGMIGAVFSYGIYFWWYRFWKNTFYRAFNKKTLTDFDITIITFLAGFINSVSTNPIWFVNTRMTLSKDKKSILQTVKEIYQNEGFSAFYKGVLANIVMLINPIIYYVTYEWLKKWLIKNNFNLNAGQLFLISSIAKTMATLVTYPILTVRIKLQANQDKQRVGLLRFTLDLLSKIGLKGLYLGVFAKLIQTIMYNSFMMVSYEKLRRLIKYLLIMYLKKRNIVREDL